MLWQGRGRERGKIVSKEPCFINVNTVTGQNDQSPSSIHNYYSTQRKRDIKSREGERSRQVQWGEQCCENEAPLSLSSAIRHPRSLQKMTPPPSLIVCVFPSRILILSHALPSVLYLKAFLSIRAIKVEWSVYSAISLPQFFLPSPSQYLICMAPAIKVNGVLYSGVPQSISLHITPTQ